jgi:hypothetical protein
MQKKTVPKTDGVHPAGQGTSATLLSPCQPAHRFHTTQHPRGTETLLVMEGAIAEQFLDENRRIIRDRSVDELGAKGSRSSQRECRLCACHVMPLMLCTRTAMDLYSTLLSSEICLVDVLARRLERSQSEVCMTSNPHHMCPHADSCRLGSRQGACVKHK